MDDMSITRLTMERMKEEWTGPLKARISELEALVHRIGEDHGLLLSEIHYLLNQDAK